MENINKFRCALCESELPYGNTVESHINNVHLISYSKYYEYCKLNNNTVCANCGNKLYRLNPWSDYVLPCLECNSKFYSRMVSTLISNWNSYLVNSEFCRLWLLNESYRDRVMNFNFLDLDKSLKNYLSKSRIRYDKLNLFKISSKPGMSPYINLLNTNNLLIESSGYRIINSELKYYDDINGYKFDVHGSKYSLILPEEVEYYNKTHYRYNILNKSSDPQSVKKLKLQSGKCIKFYNSSIDICKSILRLMKDGEVVDIMTLPDSDLEYVKFYILTNKELLKYVLNIIHEIIRHSSVVRDNVFLLNKVVVNSNGKFKLNINWVIKKNKQFINDGESVNILIL